MGGYRGECGPVFGGLGRATHLAIVLAFLFVGCDRGSADEGASAVLKAPIVTEMRTILRDVRMAQERTATETGRYVEDADLRGRLDRAVPEKYTLEVTVTEPGGYRARVVHGPSGLACELEVGAGGSTGPDCD